MAARTYDESTAPVATGGYADQNRKPTPKIGEGATLRIWTDCHACTVVKISKSGKVVWIQEDRATVVKGTTYDGSAEYTYERNPQGRIWRVSLRKNGAWKVSGTRSRENGMTVGFGHRREYRDPCF